MKYKKIYKLLFANLLICFFATSFAIKKDHGITLDYTNSKEVIIRGIIELGAGNEFIKALQEARKARTTAAA